MSEPLTHEYLVAYAIAQQRSSSPWPPADKCQHCHHNWHGAACITSVSDYRGSHPCDCPSSFEATA